ncbi:OmpA family protein [Steroidobacter sp. S1-65]|uniref:OmpA family protein n=1 Tax=Steroidobacter gossypii TaxID=2805490 RepID=A0ABS1WZD1_9GAMM|nr:OmpA family protein [Steroidobacter gossypii]MBM0106339.1 OmpA family protein [Steroidobacter gossypii]
MRNTIKTTNARLPVRIAVSAVVALAQPCAAEEARPSSGFYVAPILNAARLDDDRAVDDDAAFTFAAGFEVHPDWNFELNLFRGRFDSSSGDDLTMDAAGLDALRVFRRDTRLAPYLLLGLGAQRKDRHLSDSSTDAYADAGLGLLGALHRSNQDGRALFLRMDARARYDDMDDSGRVDYLFGVGLQYAFGSAARPAPVHAPIAPAPAPAPAPTDEDHDGVPDGTDRCPRTPAGETVDQQGCEIERDSDNDRVPDSTPDVCPNTSPGARVDARGCDLNSEIELPLVAFDHDSDRLQPQAFATLDQAAATLRLNPDLRIEVAGHTDGLGSEAYNLRLSQRRAETVRRYLIEKGVTNELRVRGYGESEPIADNGTEAGRDRNRRVVLRIIPQ